APCTWADTHHPPALRLLLPAPVCRAIMLRPFEYTGRAGRWSVSRTTRWRPWRFSLRFLLLLTAVVAAFFGWREWQLRPQRRAVARIIKRGGAVEWERRGWIEA